MRTNRNDEMEYAMREKKQMRQDHGKYGVRKRRGNRRTSEGDDEG